MTLHEPSAQADDAAREVVDAAIHVHRRLGPGLLESHYREVLVDELRRRGRAVEVHKKVPVLVDGRALKKSYQLDLRVDGCLVVEIKALRALHPHHLAQTRAYLALTGHELALVLNFHAPLMREGIRRVVHTR
ncbi:MAG TPA: GxxExxY protein [Candidatus Thermoplasmatota archaeon]|nr:GxxExxY protein [Candidatus Thermoplasmatota archaeon]